MSRFRRRSWCCCCSVCLQLIILIYLQAFSGAFGSLFAPCTSRIHQLEKMRASNTFSNYEACCNTWNQTSFVSTQITLLNLIPFQNQIKNIVRIPHWLYPMTSCQWSLALLCQSWCLLCVFCLSFTRMSVLHCLCHLPNPDSSKRFHHSILFGFYFLHSSQCHWPSSSF